MFELGETGSIGEDEQIGQTHETLQDLQALHAGETFGIVRDFDIVRCRRGTRQQGQETSAGIA